MHDDVLPCLLKGHRYWHSGRGRPILGLELLRGQGFGKNVVTSGVIREGDDPVTVSDMELNRIAGNTISIPVIGVVAGAMLGACPLRSIRPNQPPSIIGRADKQPNALELAGPQRVTGREWSWMSKCGKGPKRDADKALKKPAAKIQKTVGHFFTSSGASHKKRD